MTVSNMIPSRLLDLFAAARRTALGPEYGFLIVLSTVFFYLLWVVMYQNGSADAMTAVVEARKFPDGTPLKTGFTGIAAVDGFLSILVVFTYPVTIGEDKAAWLLMVEIVSTLQTGLAWALIDSVRIGRKSAWLAYPAILYLAVNGLGAAAVLPIYFFAHLRALPDEHWIQLWNAKPLAYSVGLGALVPGIAELAGTSFSGSSWHHQQTIAFFQASPLLVAFIQWLLSGLYPIRNIDVRTRKSAYMTSAQGALLVAGAFSAICHFVVLGNLVAGNSTLSAVYIPDSTRPVRASGTEKLLEGSRLFLQFDFIGIVLSIALWCYYLVKTTEEHRTGTIATYILGGMIAFGPGAVGSAVLYWRENIMFEQRQRNGRIRSKT